MTAADILAIVVSTPCFGFKLGALFRDHHEVAVETQSLSSMEEVTALLLRAASEYRVYMHLVRL